MLSFNFFGCESTVTTTFDQFHFQSREKLFQNDVIASFQFKNSSAMQFPLKEVVGRTSCHVHGTTGHCQPMRVSPLVFPDTYHKDWVEKEILRWHDQKIIIVIALRDGLACLVDFAPVTLISLLQPSCFLKICLPVLFTDISNFFISQTTCGYFWKRSNLYVTKCPILYVLSVVKLSPGLSSDIKT